MSFIKKYFWPIIGIIFLIVLLLGSSLGWFQYKSPIAVSGLLVPAMIGLAALIDSVNPCAFSILFLTVAFLLSLGRSRNNILLNGFLYILGIFFTYIFIGLGVLEALDFFNIPNGLAKVGAIIIIIFGLVGLLDALIPNFPIKLKIPSFAHKKIAPLIEQGTEISAFLLGIVVGMFEFPCTGGPYLFVLGILHDKESFWLGLIYLIIYNIIFVLPLAVILLIASNKKVLETIDKARRAETKKARLWLALVMMALGIVLFLL